MSHYLMYVDNNGIRHNCHELLTAFESDVAADGCIDLDREGDMSSFLLVRYLNNIQTGEITADQESYIDTLLEQYNMTNCNPNKVPLKTSVNFEEIASRLPKTPDRELVILYCKLIGEFVAINAHPLKVDLNPGSENLQNLRTKTISVIPSGANGNFCHTGSGLSWEVRCVRHSDRTATFWVAGLGEPRRLAGTTSRSPS